MGLTGEAKRQYQREYMAKRRSNTTSAGLTDGSNKEVLDPTEALNAILERKGLPNVRKGVEPMLPFDKKLQAAKRRM